MPDIMIVSDVISRMREDLAAVRVEFSHANSTSVDNAVACGHMRLGQKVSGFAHNWDQRRKELVEQIETVESNLDMIDQEFGNLDIALSESFDGN